MSSTEVTVTVTTAEGAADVPVVTATGEIDLTNAGEFAREVRSHAGDHGAALDLSELEYVDSAGFAALDSLVAESKIRIVLAERSRIRRAALLVGLPFSESVAAALHR